VARPFRLERLLGPEELSAMLQEEVREGLTCSPKAVRSRWLWDERGSVLFEAITELPEYYLSRAERGILAERGAEIAALADPETVIDLGSGSSAKTTLLLDAIARKGRLRRFVALDVGEAALRAAAARVADRYADLEVIAVVADFEHHLDRLPRGDRGLLLFLGSTIGVLEPEERAAFLAEAARAIGSHGALLLGLDLVKAVERIEAAYNDSLGLSAQLIANLLHVLNRELRAGFDPARFRSEAVWNRELERMEMVVRSLEDQVVPMPDLGLEVAFARGETLRTEISAKFRRERVEAELAAAGLRALAWWPDAAGDYAICLARRL
jgi:L-histidine N-alpha-methyltransferase